MRFALKPALSIAALIASATAPVAAGAAIVTLTAPFSNTVAATPVACGLANAAARIIDPWYPVVPRFVEGRNPGGPYGKASVAIDLDSRGDVLAARIFGSSGFPALDREAIVSASRSSYAPERSMCRTRGGTYLVTVDFDAS